MRLRVSGRERRGEGRCSGVSQLAQHKGLGRERGVEWGTGRRYT